MTEKRINISQKVLLKLDSDSIHEYIFSTGKLKQIQGASKLIDDLIFNGLPNKMELDQDNDLPRKETIIQGGGNLLVEYSFSDTISDDMIARRMDEHVNMLCDYYEQATCGATITGAWVKYQQEEYFSRALEELNQKITWKKGVPSPQSLLPGGSYLKRCESCGKGICNSFDSNLNQFLCFNCTNKETKSKETQSEEELSKEKSKQVSNSGTKRWPECWTEYAANDWQKMEEQEYYRRFPASFEDLVKDEKEGEKWLGLIYFDGNGMGETVSAIKQKEKLNKFSRKVDEALNRSVVETLSSLFSYPETRKKAPFNVLMLGGDDLVLLIKPKKACRAAEQIIDKFEQYTAKYGFPLTASAGIVFFHYKYPISKAIHAGKKLLKNAKRHACEENIKKMMAGRELPGSTVDFTLLRDPGSENPEVYRKKLRQRMVACGQDIEQPYLFCRPYEVSAFRELLEKIKNLKNKDAELSASRLNRLRQGVLAGRAKAMYTTLHAIVHGTSSQLQKNLKDSLMHGGGRKPIDLFEPPYVVENRKGEDKEIRRTVVLDIADLFPFVEGDSQKDK